MYSHLGINYFTICGIVSKTAIQLLFYASVLLQNDLHNDNLHTPISVLMMAYFVHYRRF